MIKEKLMKALKTAAADYNNGLGADMAVACAAEAWDFNEKQAERLTEMFNTAVALNKQAGEDPTGSCELADKGKVIDILFDRCSGGVRKSASASTHGSTSEYSFYSSDPDRTNPSIEARESGMKSVVKQASHADDVPDGLDLSKASIYKIINEKIAMIRSAAEAADDVARCLKMDADRGASKIAKAIEDSFSAPWLADMFKAACKFENALKGVSEYSTKVAESDGGEFARMNVFDASPVDGLLKDAEEIENCLSRIPEYERKRDEYLSKAADAESELKEILGLKEEVKSESISDFFNAGAVKAALSKEAAPAKGVGNDDASTVVKLAKMIRESGVSSEEIGKLAEDLEKDAAPLSMITPVQIQGGDAISALSKGKSIPEERELLLNVRRSILLSDLLTNDPIIRDSDPNDIIEAYKTMIMTSPRVSLDKAQVRSFLRSAANSVAISPSDAKIISDVDRGVAISNVERLTHLDSSIKDSNKA